MFNIGLFELLVILFFLILFIKPEEIPKISKNIGLFYRKINRYILNLKYELDDLEIDLPKPKPKSKSKSKSKTKSLKKVSLKKKKIKTV